MAPFTTWSLISRIVSRQFRASVSSQAVEMAMDSFARHTSGARNISSPNTFFSLIPARAKRLSPASSFIHVVSHSTPPFSPTILTLRERAPPNLSPESSAHIYALSVAPNMPDSGRELSHRRPIRPIPPSEHSTRSLHRGIMCSGGTPLNRRDPPSSYRDVCPMRVRW